MKIINDKQIGEIASLLLRCKHWTMVYKNDKKVKEYLKGYHEGKSYNAFTTLCTLGHAKQMPLELTRKQIRKDYKNFIILQNKYPFVETGGNKWLFSLSKKAYKLAKEDILDNVVHEPQKLWDDIESECIINK